jgi:hypothetical protein
VIKLQLRDLPRPEAQTCDRSRINTEPFFKSHIQTIMCSCSFGRNPSSEDHYSRRTFDSEVINRKLGNNSSWNYFQYLLLFERSGAEEDIAKSFPTEHREMIICATYQNRKAAVWNMIPIHLWPVHLLDEGVSSREDASTSWPFCSGLRGRRRTYLTILKRAWSADSKMVK